MVSLLRFETGLFLRAPSVWLLILACLVWGFLIPVDDMGPGMQALALTANYRTQYFLALSSLITPLALMIGIPLSFHRDKAHQFDSVALRFSWKKRFWPKWFALFFLLQVCLAAVPLGMSLGFLVTLETSMNWGAWLGSSVLPAWFFLGTFNAWIVLAIMSATYHVWQNSFTPYLTGIALFLIFWFSQSYTGIPMLGSTAMVGEGRWQIASGLDPFGLATFFQKTAYWTPVLKTESSFPVTQALLINRLIWSCIAMGCLVLTLRFAKNPRTVRVEKSPGKASSKEPSTSSASVKHVFKKRKDRQFWNLVIQEVRVLLMSWSFLGFMAMWAMLCLLGILMVRGSFSEGVSPRLPATSVLISYCGEPFFMFGLVLAVVFSSAILWRERRNGMANVMNCLPFSNAHQYLSKFAALNVIFVVMSAVMIGIGWSYQRIVGYQSVDDLHWLQTFYFFGLPVAVHGAFIFAVQAVAFARRHHPLTAMALSSGISMAIQFLPKMLDWHHPLLQVFNFPKLLRRHSEMRGYAQWGDLFNHMALLWGLALMPVLILVWRWWPRPESPVRFWKPGFVMSIVAFGMLAGWIGLKHGESVPFSMESRLQARASYEKRFGHLAGEPVPQVIHTYNEVDLYPDAFRLEVRARYQVKNTLNKDLQELLISARHPLNAIAFDIPFQQELIDPILNVYVIRFQEPWRQGDMVEFSYETVMASTLFDMDPALGEKGSYFLQSQFEPVLGYYEGFEIRDEQQRASQDLPEKTFRAEDRHTLYGRFVQNKRTFEVRFSTSEDQWPLTSGHRLSETVANGRRTIHYQSKTPIYPVIGYFSGVYRQTNFDANQIPVTIYTHPGHEKNLETISKTIQETVAYCQDNFGAYPYASLSVVEIPGTFPTGGRASAGVIALNEWGLFMRAPNSGQSVNTIVRRTVHEVVHQWFGEKLVPKIANGERILNESIPKYVEAMIVTRILGPDRVRTMNLASNHRYFSGRSRDAEEKPLIAANKYYLCYGKGAVVFQGLAEHWGEQRLNGVLRAFMADHRHGMTATMPDLISRLQSEADEMERKIIQDGFLERVTHQFKLVEARVDQQDGNAWLVLRIHTKSQNLDPEGYSQPHPPNVHLRVGLFEENPRTRMDENKTWETLHIQKPIQTFRIKVESLPKFVLLDPLAKQLEADRTDNLLEVK